MGGSAISHFRVFFPRSFLEAVFGTILEAFLLQKLTQNWLNNVSKKRVEIWVHFKVKAEGGQAESRRVFGPGGALKSYDYLTNLITPPQPGGPRGPADIFYLL